MKQVCLWLLVMCLWLMPGFAGLDAAASAAKIKHHDAVVALVNGDPVLFGEVWKHVHRVLEYARMEWSNPDDEFSRFMLKQLIMVRAELMKDMLFLEEVEKHKIQVVPAQIDMWVEREIEFLNMRGENITSAEDYWRVMEENTGLSEKQYRKEVEKEVKIQQFIRTHVWQADYFSPLLVRNYYKTHRDEFRTEGTVHLRHIFVPRTKDRFEAIIDEIQQALASGTAFKEVARMAVSKHYSHRAGSDGAGLYIFSVGKNTKSDPKDRQTHGAIEEELLPILQDRVKKLKVGQVGAPVPMISGTHYLKVENRSFGRVKTFAEVQGLIQEMLRRQFRDKAEKQHLKEMEEKAELKVFPFPRETPLGALPSFHDKISPGNGEAATATPPGNTSEKGSDPLKDGG